MACRVLLKRLLPNRTYYCLTHHHFINENMGWLACTLMPGRQYAPALCCHPNIPGIRFHFGSQLLSNRSMFGGSDLVFNGSKRLIGFTVIAPFKYHLFRIYDPWAYIL